jgi:RNA polymerase sigma-70 factor, ECF subfamily
MPGIRPHDEALSSADIEMVYQRSRAFARRILSREAAGHSLQATALVHEAYLRLAGAREEVEFKDDRHFFAVLAKAMRNILVDHARARSALKRGGPQVRVDLTDALAVLQSQADLYLVIDEMISDLRSRDPLRAQVFEMSFVLGFTRSEIAETLQLEEGQVKNALEVTRAWARRELNTFAAKSLKSD